MTTAECGVGTSSAYPTGTLVGAGGALKAALKAAGTTGIDGGCGGEANPEGGDFAGIAAAASAGVGDGGLAGRKAGARAMGRGDEGYEDDDDDGAGVRDAAGGGGGGRKRKVPKGSCVKVITAVRPLLPHEVGCIDIVATPSPSMVSSFTHFSYSGHT